MLDERTAPEDTKIPKFGELPLETKKKTKYNEHNNFLSL